MRKITRYTMLLLAFCLLFCFSACDAEGKDTPVRQSENTRKIYTQEMYDKFGLPTLEANITDDLGADSLDIVDLVMSLEEEFDCEIPDEEVENIKTVGDIVKHIEVNI